MLPLYCLSDCPHCGYSCQGTRARAWTTVRCRSCGVGRRVPRDRPESGPDDPYADPPLSGRKFEAGNPYRFTSDQERY